MALITERYADCITTTLSCFDRVVVTGTWVDFGHAHSMAATLTARGFRLFDYTKFAEPLRDQLVATAQRVAAETGLTIDFIRRANFRKEERIKEILTQRGDHPGLVHIFSAMETCASFQPWYDKPAQRTLLKPRTGKCLHYYFYFIDADFGLCYLRVPTWAPFRLQFYFNGHHWLSRQLSRRRIDHALADNAFITIENPAAAQKIADGFSVKTLHRVLDRYARRFCPFLSDFPGGIHWSLMQVEYATDLVFRRHDDLAPLYDGLVRTAVHAVKAEHVAMFLGRKLDPRYAGELGNDFDTRIQGTRIRHHMGWAAIKMYDKHGRVLRIETTANDVSFFKHHREVVHRDGTREFKLAPVRKSIYSLPDLIELLAASNRRYLEFLSALDAPDAGIREVEKLAEPVRENDRPYPGFNLFRDDDLNLFQAIVRGEFTISGLRNRNLRTLLKKSGGQVSRLLKRLRLHGLIKKVGRTYKYYLTRAGQAVTSAALRLRETLVLPALGELVHA